MRQHRLKLTVDGHSLSKLVCECQLFLVLIQEGSQGAGTREETQHGMRMDPHLMTGTCASPQKSEKLADVCGRNRDTPGRAA